MTFEESLARLEAIVEELDGDLPLDDALQLFEEGVARLRDASALLGAAEAGSSDSLSTTSSISSRVTARCSSSISIGDESSSMRRREAASSTRSMALSGS